MYITITDDRVSRRPGESIERTLVLSVDDEGRDEVLRFIKHRAAEERVAAAKPRTPVTVEDHRNRIIDMRSDLELAEYRIIDMRSDLELAEYTFLEQRGWAYTSRFPDHMYRWIKKLDDGPTLAVDRQTALSIEGVPA